MTGRLAPFRKYRRTDAPSNWPLVALIGLVLFNVGLYGFLFVSIWKTLR